MFRVSRRLDYGLQLMIVLASEEGKQAKSTASIAQDLQIPLPFLHQIAHTLMQTGLIKARPGPRGGLYLNKPVKEITLLQIVEALEGPITLNPYPADDPEGHARPEKSTAQFFWNDMQQKIVLHLESICLEQLANFPEYTAWTALLESNISSPSPKA